ncbi:MAG: alpha/beta hydrolase [Candidatus Nealsonbacteria bacterium]
MKEKTILINKLEVNYKIAGKGPAILVLHGWGGSSDSWIEVKKGLTRKGYLVLIPDFPGFGKSQPPQTPWSVSDYMRFLSSFLEKIEKTEEEFRKPFFLLGHSFGGRIAIKFCLSYPKEIKKLILCDSAGIKEKYGIKNFTIFWLAKIGNAILAPRIFNKLKDIIRSCFYIFIRNKDYARAVGVMKETIKKVLEEDLLPELPKIQKETLLIWGEKDRLVPLRYACVFREKIRNSSLKVLPGIGHSPHLESPRELSGIIADFFAK